MKVAELIVKLQQMPQEADVLVKLEHVTECKGALVEYTEKFDLIYIHKPNFKLKGGVENDD